MPQTMGMDRLSGGGGGGGTFSGQRPLVRLSAKGSELVA